MSHTALRSEFSDLIDLDAPVDQMLDVDRRILRMHQARDRIFQLAPVNHDRGIHGKEIVLAGMVDMQVGVENVANIPELEPVLLQLIFDHVLVRLHPAHSQRFHDLVRAVAGIRRDRPSAAEYQHVEHRSAARAAAIASEH